MVLLSGEEEVDIASVLNEFKEYLAKCLIEIKPWRTDLVSKERLIWLKVSGTPVHAWKEDLFKSVVSLVGKLSRLMSV